MKKYTNKILITGLSVFAIALAAWFIYGFYWLQGGQSENKEKADAMIMYTITDENGNKKIVAKYNGKTMVINPNTGDYMEITAETTSTSSDTAVIQVED
ncbi:MAG: hypothetical protein LBH82_06370 [Bacteroidales bacterium]|jgi:hypothetical protein|nr:hypothetical protein [Bacteroidales bacterium]